MHEAGSRLPFLAAASVYLGVAASSFAIEEQSVEIIASNIIEHL